MYYDLKENKEGKELDELPFSICSLQFWSEFEKLLKNFIKYCYWHRLCIWLIGSMEFFYNVIFGLLHFIQCVASPYCYLNH